MQAIDLLGTTFDVDANMMRRPILTAALKAATDPATAADAATAGIEAIDAALAADNYPEAVALLPLVESAAKNSFDASVIWAAKLRSKRARELQDAHAAAGPAFAAIKATPADAAARATIGRFYCLSKHDWTKGVYYLATSTDATLQPAAAMEKSLPTDAAKQAELGDLWWSAADAVPQASRQAVRAHAATWYKMAEPNLSGLAKVRAQNRIAEGVDEELPVVSDAPGKDRVIDLMPLINLSGDHFGSGRWTWIDGGLNVVADGSADMPIPYVPPQEYDFVVEYTRTAGDADVRQHLSAGGTTFTWVTGFLNKNMCWFGVLNGKWLPGENRGSAAAGFPFTNGRKHRMAVKVRKSSVTGYLDGKVVVDLKTDYTDLRPLKAFGEYFKGIVGIGTYKCTVTFHTARVTEITGRGSRQPLHEAAAR